MMSIILLDLLFPLFCLAPQEEWIIPLK